MSTGRLAVAGGGIVGLATALALAENGARVTVLEAEAELAAHQSGRNSGVIHSGLYYRPGSLKARLCVAGQRRLYELCEAEGIEHRRCGKLVLATGESELPALDELERRGRANGLEGVERLDPDGIRAREPAARGVAGLWISETGVVDYRQVCTALARRLERAGGELRLGWRLEAAERRAGRWRLGTPRGELEAAYLVTCGGLQADRLARLCGADPGLAIVPFRGDYFALAEPAASRVRGLIYPVPDPRFPFLGVHFTRRVNGTVEAGPNAVPAFDRGTYRRLAFDRRDAREALSYPGLRRLARRYWRTGLAEIGRSASRRRFAAALARLVPGITAADLRPAGCGLRAQAVSDDGRLVDDFHVVEQAGALHVLNAPSPAATASLAIGRHLAERVGERLASA